MPTVETASPRPLRKINAAEPSLAVIGCGAIAASFHVPAVASNQRFRERAILVDPDISRATALASRFGLSRVEKDYRAVLPEIDAAIVTTPHHLHYPITIDCIHNDVHVLCEKPLAETSVQVETLVKEAEARGILLAVNNTQRLYPTTRKVRELIEDGSLGKIRNIAIYWGDLFDWPTASGFRFTTGGKGALIDQGAHAIDLICWWLGGKPHLVHYHDDSMGGNEAVAKLEFELDGCSGEFHLSWLSRHENAYYVRGERASVEGSMYDFKSLVLKTSSGQSRRLNLDSPVPTIDGFSRLLVTNFADAITGHADPFVTGADVAPSIEFIEECYARRQRFAMPWFDTMERISRDQA